MTERQCCLGFSYFSGIGPKKFSLLLKEFGSAQKAWSGDIDSLQKVIGKALAPKFIEFRKKFSPQIIEKEMKKKGVYFLTLEDPLYPKLLREIKDPPVVLYCRGKFDFNSFNKTIAIVGTRKITDYGKQTTASLTTDLVQNGFVIVSGLAFGVDAVAHKTCVENKGKTIAVLGCGVDCCSPRENAGLYNRIIESGGVIVSEYPLGAQPTKGSFPSRNRIISGLSQGVIVTEGASDSGALYTAEDAIESNRPVFAVPGPITSSLSKGPHSLIAKGAKLISGAEDIISELGSSLKTKNPTSPRLRGTKQEQKIIDILQNENMHFDEIVKRTKIESSKLGSILSLMEMRGMVKSLDAGFFCLVS